MTTPSPVKGLKSRPRVPVEGGRRLVGVIASRADLRAATQMAKPPDFFELRLDHLHRILNEVERKLPLLRAPVIVTARHPREGGLGHLSTESRRRLLVRFLPKARFIDVEIRSLAAMRPVIDLARRRNVFLIASFHALKSAPTTRTVRAKLRQAKKSGAAIFKLAVRTDNAAALARLTRFFTNEGRGFPVSAMGIGKLGAISRVELVRLGSVLNYVALSRSRIEGQLRIEQLRSALGTSKITRGKGSKRERKGQSST